MLRWKPLYAGLAILSMAVSPAAMAADETGPRLVVEEPEADLGEVVKGNEVIHEFVIRNEGTEPLEIERVESSCGCTVASFDEVVAPGAAGKVSAVLETLKLNGEGTTHLRVHSNDPIEPVAEMMLEFDVVSRIQATPGYARWLTVQGEPEGTIGQTLWAEDGKDFEVLDIETPEPHIRASFRPAEASERQEGVPGPQWRIELTLDRMAPVGAIEGQALVRLSHPDQEVAPIPLSGFVRPMLFVEPQDGNWGTVEMKGVERAAFVIRNFSSGSVAITEVETGIEGVTAEVETIEEGRRYQVNLIIDPDRVAEGPFEGLLRIRTDSEMVPDLEIPLKGVLVDARDGQASTR